MVVQQAPQAADDDVMVKPQTTIRFDDLLERHLGACGRYQTAVCFLLCLVAISNAFYILEVVFVASQPASFRCDVPSANDFNVSTGTRSNGTLQDQCLVPTTSGDGGMSGYDADGDEPVPCTHWTFEPAPFRDSIVAKWSLVCGRSWLVACTHSAFLAGTLVGVLSGGVISDRFGRLPALVGFALSALVFRIVQGFSPNIQFFIVCRFFIGLTNLDTFTSAFVLGTELVGPSWRVCFGTLINQVWAVGYMLVAGIAYALRDVPWETLSFTLTGLCSYVLLFLCLVPESPRWQLSKGRQEAANKTVLRMAKVNRRQLPEGLALETTKEEKKQGTPLTLLRTSAVRWRSCIVMFVWFSVSLGYYGLSLSVGDLAGNLYFNTFIMGAVEVPAYFLAQCLLGRRLGRRGSLALLLVTTAAVLLGVLVIPKDLTQVTTGLAVIGKLGVSAAYMAAYVITAELYPTNLRQVTLSVAATVGRVGGTIAPFIGHLAVYHPVLPVTIFGVCCLVSAVLTLFLPETRNRPLPLTIEDVELEGGVRCCGGPASLYGDSDGSDSSSVPLSSPEKQHDQCQASDATCA